MRIPLLIWFGLVCCPFLLPAQDFIMQGCYWHCPEEGDEAVNAANLKFWISRMNKQAPKLSHAGFSHLQLPSLKNIPSSDLGTISGLLEDAGLAIMGDLLENDLNDTLGTKGPMRTPLQTGLYWRDQKVSAYQIHSNGKIPPGTISSLLNELYHQNEKPRIFVASLPELSTTKALTNWVQEVSVGMSPQARREISPRVVDYVLRDNLRIAIQNKKYDVRNLFDGSIRDATALSGFNIVTLVNSPLFKNGNGIPNDRDDRIENPLLAYVYILTNNQIGLPSVYYADYYGRDAEVDEYVDKEPLKGAIDQLMKIHQQYIYNSTSIDYLNHSSSDKKSVYISPPSENGPVRALVYQLDGTNSPAGLASPTSGKDVLVAINFSDEPLEMIQEINTSNFQEGDSFTDVIGNASSSLLEVGFNSEHHIANAVKINLPAKSYSIWIQGQAEQVIPGFIDFSITPYDDFIELSWEVPAEEKVMGYEIQRSLNGAPFQKIDWLSPLNNKGIAASFLYPDQDVYYNERLYYRVKMVMQDNHYEYSIVEGTQLFQPELAVELVQGRTKNEKAVKVKSNFADKGEFAVYNSKGDRVIYKKQNIQEGSNQTELDLSRLPSGVYFVTFSTRGNKVWTERVLKY